MGKGRRGRLCASGRGPVGVGEGVCWERVLGESVEGGSVERGECREKV
jgi:hypothetical protein